MPPTRVRGRRAAEARAVQQEAPNDPEREARRIRLQQQLAELGATEEEMAELISKPPLTVTEKRVDHVLTMMLDGVWVTGQSDHQLARVWKVEISVVRRASAEALRVMRRYLRDSPAERQDQLAEALLAFDRLARKAESLGTAPGLREAREARIAKLTFLGMKPPEKHLVSHNDMASWTQQQLEDFLTKGIRPDPK